MPPSLTLGLVHIPTYLYFWYILSLFFCVLVLYPLETVEWPC